MIYTPPMFELTSDNDNGINQGREVNLWRGIVSVGHIVVFDTGFQAASPQEAMGMATLQLAEAMRWAYQASQPPTGQPFDQEVAQSQVSPAPTSP